MTPSILLSGAVESAQVNGFRAALILLAVGVAVVGLVYGLASLLTVAPLAGPVHSFRSGNNPAEHAYSRYHVRWYALTMVYLAFEMEMLFMYPWVLVVRSVGAAAVVEMFLFLGILLAGVTYAWREGVLRWA